MLEAVIEPIKIWAESLILSIGYSGIFFLMLLDSANIPIPSEVIMPFGGMLASEGKLNVHLVAFAGTFGSVLGSLVSYWIGAKLGKPFLLKYGKYVLLRPKEVEHADAWFKKYGVGVTLWGRFIPLVRTFISLPAGMFNMPIPLFMLYALLGALPWNYAWSYVGYLLGKNWSVVEENMKYADLAVVLVLGYFVVRYVMSRKRAKENTDDTQPEPSSPA